MKMTGLFYFYISLQIACYVSGEIRKSPLINRLKKVKPVGKDVHKSFLPLTEVPAPKYHTHKSGRRHFNPDCTDRPDVQVEGGPNVQIWGDYYDERQSKTVKTIVFPDHIDKKHFEVTTSDPYLTVGVIDAIGFHPVTGKNEHPNECERIYEEHMAGQQYSEETSEIFEDESLEMARIPVLYDNGDMHHEVENRMLENYSDLDLKK